MCGGGLEQWGAEASRSQEQREKRTIRSWDRGEWRKEGRRNMVDWQPARISIRFSQQKKKKMAWLFFFKKKRKKKLLETERAKFKSIVMLKNCQAFKNRWWRNTNTVTTNTVTFYSDDFMLNPIFLRLSENAHLCCGVIVFSIFISSFF